MFLQERELRIGNWVKFHGNNCQIAQIVGPFFSVDPDFNFDYDFDFKREFGNSIYAISDCFGIFITREILLRLGFEKGKDSRSYRKRIEGSDAIIKVSFQRKGWPIVAISPTGFNAGNAYANKLFCVDVHNIQNIYHGMGGEELDGDLTLLTSERLPLQYLKDPSEYKKIANRQ